MTANARKAQPAAPTRLLVSVSVPDTPMISRAIDFARERSEPYLFNHVMRSWLFAALVAQRKQTAHDGEVLAVITILHDLGLAESFDGPLRFEVEGANAARDFARTEGMDDRRAVHAGKRQVPAKVAALLADHLGEEDVTATRIRSSAVGSRR